MRELARREWAEHYLDTPGFRTRLATCGPADYAEWAASVEAALGGIDSFVAANLDGVVARVGI